MEARVSHRRKNCDTTQHCGFLGFSSIPVCYKMLCPLLQFMRLNNVISLALFLKTVIFLLWVSLPITGIHLPQKTQTHKITFRENYYYYLFGVEICMPRLYWLRSFDCRTAIVNSLYENFAPHRVHWSDISLPLLTKTTTVTPVRRANYSCSRNANKKNKS